MPLPVVGIFGSRYNFNFLRPRTRKLIHVIKWRVYRRSLGADATRSHKVAYSRTVPLFKVAAFMACVGSFAWSQSARAEGSSLPYGRGGRTGVPLVIAQYNRTGELFRIEGDCRSSCTMLLAIRNVCVDPNATLEFHAAIFSPQETPTAARNNWMSSHYNERLRSFLVANHYLDSWTFHPISGSDIIHKFGYRQCPNK